MREPSPTAVYLVSWSPYSPPELAAEVGRGIAPPPCAGLSRSWLMLGSALARMQARAARLAPGVDLLTWSPFTGEHQIADELSIALGLPGTIGGTYDRAADMLEHTTETGSVAVTWQTGKASFAPLRCEGFKIGSRAYVGLLAFVSPLRCMAVPAAAAAFVVLAMRSSDVRDPRDTMLLLDEAATKAWPEVSASLDRRRAGSTLSANDARMRKLGTALGRDGLVKPCPNLLSLASLGQGPAIVSVGQPKVATS